MVGPVLARELVTAPRRNAFYFVRTVFVAALFAVTLTAWQLLIGSQSLENPGDLAWFGAAAFQILAPLQLAVALPFSALLVASAVALEKDRKTLDLLLLTNVSNSELVLGKLLSGMLSVIVVIAAAWPFMMMVTLLGGVSFEQVLRVETVLFVSTLAAGSLGSTIALWREKTFQSLAMTVLLIVLWLAVWEVASASAVAKLWGGQSAEYWAAVFSPWHAIQQAARPRLGGTAAAVSLSDSVVLFAVAFLSIAAGLNVVAIAKVRTWNPTREVVRGARRDLDTSQDTLALSVSQSNDNVHSADGKVRAVWNNPVLWRDMCTWAYGKKILLVRLAYWAVFLICAAAVARGDAADLGDGATFSIPTAARSIIALTIVGLLLLNALAVTSLTNERDSGALDLLLVTDLSPKEIVFGKLGGAFYNAKEMILLPIALCIYLWWNGQLSTQHLIFLAGGQLVMTAFAAMLGVHAAITYANSRAAIATSLGTLLFLFLGVATCMRIMLAFSESFDRQFAAFLGFIAGGSLAMYVVLGWRNPSGAIILTSLVTPISTFVLMTSFLLGNLGTVFLLATLTYGFATWAMLVPAIYVFDVATIRTGARDG